MRKYETVFIVDGRIEEEAYKGLVEKIKALIEKNATLEGIEEWGKKKMAYEIEDVGEGYYTLMNFSASPAFPHELERVYKITDRIIKHMILKKD